MQNTQGWLCRAMRISGSPVSIYIGDLRRLLLMWTSVHRMDVIEAVALVNRQIRDALNEVHEAQSDRVKIALGGGASAVRGAM